MSLSLPKCDFCKHLHEENNIRSCCDAFPEGIPLEVMIADKSVECNNGIKYDEA